MKYITLLLTALAAVAGCTSAQEVTEEKLVSDINVTIEGTDFHGNGFPALKIHINRKGVNEGSCFVRFPEMIEASEVKTDSFMKFYQDNRDPAWPVDLECEPLGLPVKWQGDDKSLSYELKFDNGMVLNSSARVEGTKVIMSHKLTNGTDMDLKDVKMWNCVQNVFLENINDPKMERTSTITAGEYELFKNMIPASKEYTDKVKPELQRFLGFKDLNSRSFKECPHVIPHPGFPDDPDQRIYFWESDKAIDVPIIATMSKDGQWGVATMSSQAPGVWSNPGISCQHADRAYPLCKAGETIDIVNQVVVFEGSPSQLSVE